MSTPRKNFNYPPPYSKKVEYPSQNMDYMSQHNSGQQSHFTPDRSPYRSNQNTPHFYQCRAPQQQNAGFYEERQGSKSNTQHFYQSKPYQHQGTPRNFGHRGGKRGQHQRQFNEHNTNSFSQYFHSSMLEDPWRELMERHNAIHGSIIEDQQSRNLGI